MKTYPFLNHKVNFPLCLAPMVGLSHLVLREALRDYLPPGAVTLWPTEMLNSRKIPNEKVGFTSETMKHSADSELVPQILGNEAEPIRQTIERLEAWGAEGIDINMGCPVKKALKHNYGVALMGDPDYAQSVVDMAVRSTTKPVSVKLRAGFQNDPAYLLQFVKGLQNKGAQWITLHPRKASQRRRGFADWEQIRWLKKNLEIPVVGNGDIQQAQDVFQMLEETSCDMVMSGRALAAKPWILWQVGSRLGFANPTGRENQKPPGTPGEEAAEYQKVLLGYLEKCDQYFSEGLARRKFLFYVKMTSPWLNYGNHLLGVLIGCKDSAQMKFKIENFFNPSVEMTARTQLWE